MDESNLSQSGDADVSLAANPTFVNVAQPVNKSLGKVLAPAICMISFVQDHVNVAMCIRIV